MPEVNIGHRAMCLNDRHTAALTQLSPCPVLHRHAARPILIARRRQPSASGVTLGSIFWSSNQSGTAGYGADHVNILRLPDKAVSVRSADRFGSGGWI